MHANQTLTITEYASQLFPDMTSLQVQEAAYIYQGYGTALEQAIMMTGDCEFKQLRIQEEMRSTPMLTLPS